jgi:4-cresol dehydrogenase (hydroxylating)
MVNPFAAVLDGDGVVADVADIDGRYMRNVSAIRRRIPLVLRPRTEDEVARIVAIANARHLSLYPFSTGKNWGLGSKLPVSDDSVLLDLSRMVRIIEVNETCGYAILEPGVTQLQLAQHLAEHHPTLTMNFTGSFAYTGIVGNVLDRGDGGHARIDDLLGVRGILGNGRPFCAGGFWDAVGDARPSHIQRYAAGPDLAGMFTQSNLGVVTQLVFRLIRKPPQRAVFWGTTAGRHLERLADAIERLASYGVISRGSVNIGYANRFVQAKSTLGAAGPATTRDEWNFYVLLGGTPRTVDAACGELESALRALCSHMGVIRFGPTPEDHDPLDALPPFLQPLVRPLLGMPDAESLELIYRLTGTKLPQDRSTIDADHTPFGMKCCIPLVPPRGSDVRRAADLVARAGERFDLNVKASFFGDGRTLITIHFRTDEPEQIRRAADCEQALWDDLLAAGFGPYRLSIDQMERWASWCSSDYSSLVTQIKSALDPNGVIAPGRYCPSQNRPAGPIPWDRDTLPAQSPPLA